MRCTLFVCYAGGYNPVLCMRLPLREGRAWNEAVQNLGTEMCTGQPCVVVRRMHSLFKVEKKILCKIPMQEIPLALIVALIFVVLISGLHKFL